MVQEILQTLRELTEQMKETTEQVKLSNEYIFCKIIPIKSETQAETTRDPEYRVLIQKSYGDSCAVLSRVFPGTAESRRWVAAHLLQRNYELFSLIDMHPDDRRNGLPLHRNIEKQYDHFNIAIVVISGSESVDSMCCMVHVHPSIHQTKMHPQMSNGNLDMTKYVTVTTGPKSNRQVMFSELHGVQLNFSDTIPFRRSLLLHHAACYKRHNGKGFPPPDPSVLELCQAQKKHLVRDALLCNSKTVLQWMSSHDGEPETMEPPKS